ncbi:MAG: glycosyltransferase N-terminal domain-containing protein [Bacteroidales bacterium]|nr:glycosyltransferase N-terminal domain-containing protein [Bacteroidales bacterium]
MHFLYSFFIYCFGFAIRLASLFNVKARKWVKGRAGLFEEIEAELKQIDRKKTPIIWFHASSLGEFEQGRPVIEDFRKRWPTKKILLTFYSPSGYDVRKEYSQADFIFYLPLDTPTQAEKWVKLVNPQKVFFIKYDFWFNLMGSLYQRKIPVYFIAALFRPDQFFFKWYGGWFRKQLTYVSRFFVQNAESEYLLNSIGLQNVTRTGDTRFDRVFANSQNKQHFPLVEQFCEGKNILIGGSIWPPDEEILLPLIEKMEIEMKFILAPHDTSPERIQSLTRKLKLPFLLYSEMNSDNFSKAGILIIDSVGILAQLYQYATLAFIGGGFGTSIHNIQEPITFGVPVFFGPKYHKFKEAVDLVQQGGAFCIHHTEQLEKKVISLLADKNEYQKASSLCKLYVETNRGATDKIVHYFL